MPADRRRLRRLLQNLIANALKLAHLAPPPPSRSAPSGPGDEWTFSVYDNGIGLRVRQRHRHPATYAGDPHLGCSVNLVGPGSAIAGAGPTPEPSLRGGQRVLTW